jgi:L-fuconolactonase
MTSVRIDAHHHLWKYSNHEYPWISDTMTALRRNFLTEDLKRELQDAAIDACISVQARQTLQETEWLLDIADHHQFIKGVVGWVPLIDETICDQLERIAARPKLVGVRHVLHDEPDDFYILREDFNRGIGVLKNFDLAYDILVFERHLPQTIQFVDQHPKQRFILDHIAKPRIKENILSPWRENIFELAKRRNVYCKLSGLLTEANWKSWTERDLEPYFDIVLEAFRPERLMFGSDWPVVTLASGYKRWVDTVSRLISRLSVNEQSRIFGGTAEEAYQLGGLDEKVALPT